MMKKRMAGENLKEDRRWLNHFNRRHTEQLNNKSYFLNVPFRVTAGDPSDYTRPLVFFTHTPCVTVSAVTIGLAGCW